MKNNLLRVALALALLVTLAGCDKQGSKGVIAPQGAPASSDFRHIRAAALQVTGDTQLSGSGFDVDITGGFDVDADLASSINTAAGDITIEAETGSVVIKGDEAVADAVYIDANEAAGAGLTVATGATAGAVFTGGAVILPRKTIAKTGTTINLTAAEVAWTIVSDLGDTGGITITLPAAAAGMDVLLYNKTGNDWIVDCDNADQIFDLTDAAGNKITNTTAFDYVHLIALDGTGWYPLDVHGTWTDAN